MDDFTVTGFKLKILGLLQTPRAAYHGQPCGQFRDKNIQIDTFVLPGFSKKVPCL